MLSQLSYPPTFYINKVPKLSSKAGLEPVTLPPGKRDALPAELPAHFFQSVSVKGKQLLTISTHNVKVNVYCKAVHPYRLYQIFWFFRLCGCYFKRNINIFKNRGAVIKDECVGKHLVHMLHQGNFNLVGDTFGHIF